MKIIVITGPTSVGKTKLSIELAKKIDGEIINADSMQIYKGLNIGTAKITEEEKENIPHYLFDIKNVDEEYSIYNYQKECRTIIDDILNRNKIPILVGGTGLYIKSALYDYTLTQENTENDYEELTTSELYSKLLTIDKNIDIDKNNRRRLIRALNYYNNTGLSISTNKNGENLLYDTIFIGLTTDRNTLYERINNRVCNIISAGLIEEVKYYYDKNIKTKPLTGGIGYKELYEFFDKKVDLETAIDNIKKNSRRYAKRQYTFFNNKMYITWFNTDFNNFNKTVNEVLEYLKKK